VNMTLPTILPTPRLAAKLRALEEGGPSRGR
jgi:hypothetical protein